MGFEGAIFTPGWTFFPYNTQMNLTRARITERLNLNNGAPIPGDHALNPDMRPPADNLTPAAVLIVLVARGDGFSVLLTKRTDDLEHHPGQISFPGGHVDACDTTSEACALRELEEETGIPAALVTPIGRLDTYTTRTGFAITPVVGFLDPPFDVRPDPREVAEVFEVPLDFLMNAKNHQRMSHETGGKTRYYYAMPFQGRYIWGATAGMLVNLHAALIGAHTP